MRISDWSSDVCSSDLSIDHGVGAASAGTAPDLDQRRGNRLGFSGAPRFIRAIDDELVSGILRNELLRFFGRSAQPAIVILRVEDDGHPIVDFHHRFHRIDHDHRVAIPPFVARSPESRTGRDWLVGYADPGAGHFPLGADGFRKCGARSEEHTSELHSLMRITYAV